MWEIATAIIVSVCDYDTQLRESAAIAERVKYSIAGRRVLLSA